MIISGCLKTCVLLAFASIISFLTLPAGELPLTTSSACLASNKAAVDLLIAERAGEVEALLSPFSSQPGDSPEDCYCMGLSWNNIAQARNRLGRFSQAETAVSRSIELLEKAYAGRLPEHSLRPPLHLLTSIALERGLFTKAEKLLARAEKLPESTLRDLAIESGLHAVMEAIYGRWKEAEVFGRRAMKHWSQAGLADTMDAVSDLSNLGHVLLRQARAEEAATVLDRCLRIIARAPRSASLETKTLLVRAAAEWQMHRPSMAEEYFQKAIQALATVPGDLRAEIGRPVYQTYSAFLADTRRGREAKAAAEQARAFGPDAASAVVDLKSLLPRNRR